MNIKSSVIANAKAENNLARDNDTKQIIFFDPTFAFIAGFNNIENF